MYRRLTRARCPSASSTSTMPLVVLSVRMRGTATSSPRCTRTKPYAARRDSSAVQRLGGELLAPLGHEQRVLLRRPKARDSRGVERARGAPIVDHHAGAQARGGTGGQRLQHSRGLRLGQAQPRAAQGQRQALGADRALTRSRTACTSKASSARLSWAVVNTTGGSPA